MNNNEIINAKITGTMLGLEDHGIFTSYLYLDYEKGMSQGFGGYVLGDKYGSYYIKEILRVVGVEKWEDLKGKHIRVKRDLAQPSGWGYSIKAIGNILEDIWFDPKQLAEDLKSLPYICIKCNGYGIGKKKKENGTFEDVSCEKCLGKGLMFKEE